mmetsp:Transcript_26290/g.72237  ORF Transcript_26290/g.72237 Transcript_26290/m.72237 type:complete len:84 (+) Transcript_26290:152-403(+)
MNAMNDGFNGTAETNAGSRICYATLRYAVVQKALLVLNHARERNTGNAADKRIIRSQRNKQTTQKVVRRSMSFCRCNKFTVML